MTEFLPVYEAQLDEEELSALFRDLSELASPVEVALKRGPTQRAEEGETVTLAQAHELLRRREVRGVQLRYTHTQKLWCDTLIAVGAKVRVVRVELPVNPTI